MTIVTTDLMISLDGCIAGPHVGLDNPAGDGAARLHDWIASLASWRERQGMTGGVRDAESAMIGEWFDTTGAVVMGRMMFDTGEAFWGEDPPFRAPVFIVTNRPRPAVEKRGGTSYTFVPDGVEHAIALAKAAAGTRNVDVGGGADTIQQCLRAGLIDEIHLHVLPFVMGDGLRLFDRLGPEPIELEPIHVIQGPQATHLKYRVRR